LRKTGLVNRLLLPWYKSSLEAIVRPAYFDEKECEDTEEKTPEQLLIPACCRCLAHVEFTRTPC